MKWLQIVTDCKDTRPKGEFCSFRCGLLLFLGGGCTLNEIFCGFKTQRAKRENDLPPPAGTPS